MRAMVTFCIVMSVAAPAFASLAGDVNGDGQVDIVDISILAIQWLNTGSGWDADIDGSQKVDFADFSQISRQWQEFIIEDPFDDSGSLASWQIVDEGTIRAPSIWAVVSGELSESSNIHGPDATAYDNRKGTFAYWKDPQAFLWTDYKFKVSLRSTDNDGIGVIFRYVDTQNYYKFDMDSQKAFRKLFKMHNGVETTLAASLEFGYSINTVMNLDITVLGNEITVFMDGVNVFGSTLTDSDNTRGTIGLYSWGNGDNKACYFDNFWAHIGTDIEPGETAVAAYNDRYLADVNSSLTVSPAEGVLSNDLPADGSLTAQLVTSPQNGQIVLNPNGAFVYTPGAGFIGSDSFSYKAVAPNQNESPATVAIRVRSATEYSIIVLPDTQKYALSYPDIAYSQTQWIVDNKDALRIAFVLHEGDLTDDNNDLQMSRASTAMTLLENGGVPYAAVVGNHDTGTNGTSDSRTNIYFDTYFPVSRFSSLPQFGGVFEANKMENSYHYFTAGGIDWLVLALEFGPRAVVLNWANDVVNAHPNHRVIVLTHAYMYSNDTRIGVGDSNNPHNYDLCANITDPDNVCNDGEEMWTHLVKLHANMTFVFSGHILNDGAGKLVSTGDNGNAVYQMLANYQFEASGGSGYLRIITLCPELQKVIVETYSPWLDQYRDQTDQQFEFNNVDLSAPQLPACVNSKFISFKLVCVERILRRT